MLKLKFENSFQKTEIGEIPDDWKTSNLGDKSKFTIIMGQSPPSRYYNQDGKGMPFIQGKKEFGDLFVETETWTTKCGKVAPAGSVIITVRAPVGELNMTKDELCIGRGVAAVLDKDRDSRKNRFIYYLLKGLTEHLLLLGEGGTTYESTTKKELEDFLVIYPPLDEQVRIAAVLCWFDDLIENKKRQNEILEKTAMAIFKRWFADLEPFKDEEFENSELGKIPKDWVVKPIGEVAEFKKGISYKGEEKFDAPTGYVFVTLNNILRGGDFKTEYSWIKSDRIAQHQFVEEEALVMANTDMTQDAKVIGSPAIVIFPYDYKGEGVYSHHITKITPKNKEFKLFLYLFLKRTQDENTTFSTGTNVLGLDVKNFKRNKIVVVPPQVVLEKFNFLVENLFRKMTLNKKQIMILQKIRDTLLPVLIFGKLRVEEI